MRIFATNYLEEFFLKRDEIEDKKNYIKIDNDIYYAHPNEPLIYNHFNNSLQIKAYKVEYSKIGKIDFIACLIVLYFKRENPTNSELKILSFTDILRNKKIKSVSIYKIDKKNFKGKKIILGESNYNELVDKLDEMIDGMRRGKENKLNDDIN